VDKSCGVNKCPYPDSPFTGRVKSSPSTWHGLIFLLFCNAVSVVLTAFLPSLLAGDADRSAALPVIRWQATPLDEQGGYRIVGAENSSAESPRRKTTKTLYLFGDRRLLLLAPTIIVAGHTGSFVVAAFHQVIRQLTLLIAKLSAARRR